MKRKSIYIRKEFLRLLNISSTVCMSGSWPPNKISLNYTEFIVAAKEKEIEPDKYCEVGGVACGSGNCIREDLGMFYKSDVDNLLGSVEVTRLNLN